MAEVASQRVSRLWPRRVPFGKLTILDGDPGLGKSTLILDLAARLSAARSMPDRSPAAPLSVPSLPSPAGANSAHTLLGAGSSHALR
jgi:hypothetical protein